MVNTKTRLDNSLVQCRNLYWQEWERKFELGADSQWHEPGSQGRVPGSRQREFGSQQRELAPDFGVIEPLTDGSRDHRGPVGS